MAAAPRAASDTTRAGAAQLRRDAERLAAPLDQLMAKAERLAATVFMGAHGRRRPGVGETFWQYRRAMPGDPLSAIDWRRSARSDALYVRETEWEAAQTVWIWCDRSLSMDYRSADALPSKRQRAIEIAAAMAILLVRAGERIALPGTDAARPGSGEARLGRVVYTLATPEDAEFGAPPSLAAARGGRAVFISDFFGEEEAYLDAIRAAAARGLSGLALQVVDPAEESFPFDGRLVFESMSRTLRYETDRAGALRDDYRAALAARRGRLEEVARRAGWRFSAHRSDQSAAPALLWLHRGLSEGAGVGGLELGGR